jgi:hypothetical protein
MLIVEQGRVCGTAKVSDIKKYGLVKASLINRV